MPGFSGRAVRCATGALGALLLLGCPMATAAPQPPKCLASPQFQVVYREKAVDVGSDILVQRLDGKPRKCAFDRKDGDYRVGGPDDANYVLGLSGNVLVLDQGTGPDRTLALYDLDARKVVLSQDYDSEQPVKIEPGKISFRAVTGPANASNCSEFRSFAANGLEAALTQAAEVTLPGAKLALSGKVGCIPRQ